MKQRNLCRYYNKGPKIIQHALCKVSVLFEQYGSDESYEPLIYEWHGCGFLFVGQTTKCRAEGTPSNTRQSRNGKRFDVLA